MGTQHMRRSGMKRRAVVAALLAALLSEASCAAREAEKILKKVCEEIFCRELEGWYTDEEVWPKDRSLKVFKQWFEIQHFEIVEDVGRGPIENDEGPDERHRFQPPPPPRRPAPKRKPRS